MVHVVCRGLSEEKEDSFDMFSFAQKKRPNTNQKGLSLGVDFGVDFSLDLKIRLLAV